MAVLAKKHLTMIPSMVAHHHMVLCLHQRAAQHLAWLEYNIQLQMELAASGDRRWKEGDPWQYIACLPNNLQQGVYPEAGETAEAVPPHRGKGKRVLDPKGGSGRGTGQNPKKPKSQFVASSTWPQGAASV